MIDDLLKVTHTGVFRNVKGPGVSEIFYVRPVPLMTNFSLFVKNLKNNFSLSKGGGRRKDPLNTSLVTHYTVVGRFGWFPLLLGSGQGV